MFQGKTEKIISLAKDNPKLIEKLNYLLSDRTIMYIDYANIRPWSNKLKFHIDIKRLKQFLDSFDQIENIRFYYGTLIGDKQSEKDIQELHNLKYILKTKPVKIMDLSIDVTSLQSIESTDLLKDFIRKPLMKTFNLDQIETLNNHLRNLNEQGYLKLQDRKCNFDVEIGVDMLLDLYQNKADTFILWSSDSDFTGPLKQLLDAKKKVILFATAGRVARELNNLKESGLCIFDIKDLQKFICWSKELKQI